jgi:hypothetical protein
MVHCHRHVTRAWINSELPLVSIIRKFSELRRRGQATLISRDEEAPP